MPTDDPNDFLYLDEVQTLGEDTDPDHAQAAIEGAKEELNEIASQVGAEEATSAGGASSQAVETLKEEYRLDEVTQDTLRSNPMVMGRFYELFDDPDAAESAFNNLADE